MWWDYDIFLGHHSVHSDESTLLHCIRKYLFFGINIQSKDILFNLPINSEIKWFPIPANIFNHDNFFTHMHSQRIQCGKKIFGFWKIISTHFQWSSSLMLDKSSADYSTKITFCIWICCNTSTMNFYISLTDSTNVFLVYEFFLVNFYWRQEITELLKLCEDMFKWDVSITVE